MKPAIAKVNTDDELEQFRQLLEEYAAFLGFDLSFQHFEEELAGLPGIYSPPEGRILMAHLGAQVAGCVALRMIDRQVCEMKRLFVRPQYRGQGVGRALAIALLREAEEAGYARIRLDTVPTLSAAIALYRSLGFHEIPPYRLNPRQGATFWECDLQPTAPSSNP